MYASAAGQQRLSSGFNAALLNVNSGVHCKQDGQFCEDSIV
jgi:hypothetical protein